MITKKTKNRYMDKNETLKLSVLDVEERYKYEYSEPVYSTEQIVSYGSDNLAPILFNNLA